MFPNNLLTDPGDRSLRDPIALSNSVVGFAPGCESNFDFDDLISCQPFAHPASPGRVVEVFCLGAPLKVGKQVVGPVEVKMVDVRQIGWVGQEGDCNHTVDQEHLGFAGLTEDGAQSGLGVTQRNEHPLSHKQCAATVRDFGSNSSNPPMVTDFVQPFVPDDGQPTFGHRQFRFIDVDRGSLVSQPAAFCKKLPGGRAMAVTGCGGVTPMWSLDDR